MYRYRDTYLKEKDDIHSIPCGHKYIYDRGDGRITAYLHWVDGMQIFEWNSSAWEGWRLMLYMEGEKVIC